MWIFVELSKCITDFSLFFALIVVNDEIIGHNTTPSYHITHTHIIRAIKCQTNLLNRAKNPKEQAKPLDMSIKIWSMSWAELSSARIRFHFRFRFEFCVCLTIVYARFTSICVCECVSSWQQTKLSNDTHTHT